MKVLISTQCYLPIPATLGGAVQTLIEHLINQNELKRNHVFTVITCYNEEAIALSKKYSNTNFIFLKNNKFINFLDNFYEKIYEITFRKKHEFKKKFFWKSYVLYKTKKIMKSNNFDRVVFQNSGFLIKTLKNKILSQKYSNKCFYHLHNDIPDNIDISCLKQCRLIAISKYLTKKINQISNNYFLKKIYILKNAVETEIFMNELTAVEKNNILKKTGIPKDNKIILFVGRISKEKGILELIEAFEKIKNNKITLLIAGSHNFGSSEVSDFSILIEEKIKKLGDKVVFTGYVEHSNIWKYYKLCDLAILPSIWEEPAGLTMLEAIAAGSNLITTNSGGIPEYISDKYAHFINITPHISEDIKKNIIDVLIKNKQKQKAPQKYLEEYSVENYYLNFCQILENDINE